MARSWIPRTEVLDRLGVKPQTLYAYVSRGRIAAKPDPDDPRRSLYAAEDVTRLADRSVKHGKPQALGGGAVSARGETVIDSALTSIADGRIYYRGRDAVTLADTATLEQAARILWDAEEDPFADLKPRVDVSFGGGPRVRAFQVLARRAEEDSTTVGRADRSLRREAASVLNELVDALSGGGPRLYLHQRLSRMWKLEERDSALIRRALVLSADTDLGAPAVVARTAAAAGAPLSAAVLAALTAQIGPPYGGRLNQTIAYVAEARRGADPRAIARQRLAQGLEIPGFGHPLFPEGDPRAKALIEAMRLPDEMADIVRVGEGLTGQAPNFDMALALLGRQLDLPKDSMFAVQVTGRAVGWLGHALEQVQSGSPIRARLRYVGNEPEIG